LGYGQQVCIKPQRPFSKIWDDEDDGVH